MPAERQLFIVDQDTTMPKRIARELRGMTIHVESFESADMFLDQYDPARDGCLLVDVELLEADLEQLQRRAKERGKRLPPVIATGEMSATAVVRAFEAGAKWIMPKPIRLQELIPRVVSAVEQDANERAYAREYQRLMDKFALLSPRERVILRFIVDGESAKTIAARLGTSHYTVKNQRASILAKTRARSDADVVRMAMTLEFLEGRWRSDCA